MARSSVLSKTACAFAAASALLITGCAQNDVCSAVGYMQTLTIKIEGDNEQVAEVIVCGKDGCPDSSATETDGISTDAAQSSSDDATWTATLSYLEEPLTVRLIDANGMILSEIETAPDWVRTGGTERCGGPSAAEITVSV